MKKMLLIMVLVAAAFYLLLTNYFSNVEINKYDSVASVKEKKAIEQGWIPKILPHSAYNIVETHDADTHTIVGKFNYKEKDEATFLASLTESNETYVGENFLFKIDKEQNLVNFRNKKNKQ